MTHAIRAAALTLAFALLPATGGAQDVDPRPLSIADIMGLKRVGSPVLSPDGRTIVYTLSQWEHPEARGQDLGTRHEARSHLWLVSAAGGEPRQLTFGERGESAPAWSPDGRHVAFRAARGSGGGVSPQIWLLPMVGGEASSLTSAKHGVAVFTWSPDGSRIAYVTRDSASTEEAARARRRDDAIVYEEDYPVSHVWVIDVETQEAVEIAHGDFTVRAAPSWSPDGTRVAFSASPTPLIRDLRGGFYIAQADGTGFEQIAPGYRPYPDLLDSPAWSPDGRTLAFSTMDEPVRIGADEFIEVELEHRELVLYDVASGESRPVSDPAFDYDIGGVQWSADGRRLIFVTGDRAYRSVFEYDVAADRFTRVAREMLLGELSFSSDGETVAFALETSDAPADVYVSDARFGAPRRVTDVNPQVRALALGETEIVTWRSPDGTQVEGVLVRPVGFRDGERYPLLVDVHGGPTAATSAGFKASSSAPGQFWAGRGWAVLYPNPRGSTNYGEEFMQGNLLDWGGGDYEDVMSGVDELIRRGIADSTRMAILGWSYGGYLTAWAVTQTSRFKAARMGAGMSAVESMYLTSDIPGYIGTFFGGPPTPATLERYRARSPVTFAQDVTTPLLIMHGDGDDRVPKGQALAFYRALRDAGKTVELVLYPRAGHGISEYYHQIDRIQREYDWISRYTLGAGESTQ